MKPCLNRLSIGTYVKTPSMRIKKALLYNAESLRVDLPISKPQEMLAKIRSMNSEQRCDYRHASESSISNEDQGILSVFPPADKQITTEMTLPSVTFRVSI